MTATPAQQTPVSEQAAAEATAAAQAAAALLPASGPLTPGPPGADPDQVTITGQAAAAKFAGSVQGELVAVVAQDLVDAMKDSPLGELDLAKAVQPALEAAGAVLGQVVVEPATLMDPAVALQSLAAKGPAVYVPLLDGEVVRAALALVVTGRPGGPATLGTATATLRRGGLDLLHDVEMEVTAELGRTRMTVRELLGLSPGAIVELDRAAGSPADLLVNGRLIASGEVVVIDENFGLRITEINPTGERS